MSAPVVTPTSTSTCSLLTWKDPVQTAKVFGGIVTTLIVFKFVNLFNLFFHLAYLGLLAAAAAEYAGKLVTGQGFVTKYKPGTKSFAAKFNADVLPSIAKFNTKVEAEVQNIVYAHDIETTLKAGGISYILYKLTSWFSLYTLVFSAVVLTFTVPAAYFHNKKEVDAAIHQYSQCAQAKFSELTKVAHEKAAPHFETLAKKTGPIGTFISSKIPTRTAGSTVGSDRSTSYASIPASTKPAAAKPAPANPVVAKSADVTVPVSVEPEVATTTGASKFPDVPASLQADINAAVHEAKTKTGEVPAPNL
ncbi:hypothetical protein CAAN1_14S02344 [[Candida] anglica]|uniref:Reticulon-like protein n=1 Tax=[Candida] anglica TaxID=148631 RepID=A0ABP0EM87_9ASCO